MELSDIWGQAVADRHAVSVEDTFFESRINNGIKIKRAKSTGEIRIFNISVGGDAYRELSRKEYAMFKRDGWRNGCYLISLSVYKDRLKKAIAMRDKHIANGDSKMRQHAVESSIETYNNKINSLKSKLYGERI